MNLPDLFSPNQARRHLVRQRPGTNSNFISENCLLAINRSVVLIALFKLVITVLYLRIAFLKSLLNRRGNINLAIDFDER